MNPKDSSGISVKTIRMQPPIILADNRFKRQPVIHDERIESLVTKEAFLRQSAYKNTMLKTDASFFDDSDMKSDYYLTIVYDKSSDTPLLSSRYYFDRSVIGTCLKGDTISEAGCTCSNEKFDIDRYEAGDVFLADRLSGNTGSSLYRRHRSRIFQLFYSEIVKHNNKRTLLLMVRKEKHNKQLSNYLNMGFVLIGSTLHKGKEHAIITCDLRKA